MMFQALHATDAESHARWLHELRNVVSTAHVATAMSRRLVAQDPSTAAELLREAELALLQCRDLLDVAGEHVRDDEPRARVAPPPRGPRRRTVGEEVDRIRGRRAEAGAIGASEPSPARIPLLARVRVA